MTSRHDISWSGTCVSLAGRFSSPSRAEVIAWLKLQGAQIQTQYSSKTEVLITGARPGVAVDAANARLLPVLDVSELPEVGEPQDVHQRLERLRSLVFGPRTPEAWSQLMGLLDTWSQEPEIGYTYAMRNLESWPDALRTAPEALLAPEPRAALTVARSLDLDLVPREHLERWLQALPESLHHVRVLRSRTHRWSDAHVDALARSPWRESLRELDLQHAHLEQSSASRLRDMESLERVCLSHNALHDALPELLRLPRLRELTLHNASVFLEPPGSDRVVPTLTSLDLSYNHIEPASLRVLLRHYELSNLTRLNLRYNDLRTNGAEVLHEELCRARLRALDVGGNEIGDGGAKWISMTKPLDSLETLAIEGNVAEPLLTNQGAGHLGDSKVLTKLRDLRLGGNQIGDEGLRALLELPKLERLDLRANEVTAHGLRAFQGTPAQLRHLNLSYQDLSGAHFDVLDGWGELRTLTFVFCELDLRDLERLCANPWLSELRELDVSTYTAREGTCALLARGAFSKLERLNLMGVPLETSDVQALVDAPFAATLTHLRVDRRRRDAVAALAKALPHVTLEEA